MEPLKNQFNQEFVAALGKSIWQHSASFQSESFQKAIFSDNYEKLELKQRMRRISLVLRDFLPDEYEEALAHLTNVSDQFSGLKHMVFADFVEVFGIKYFDISIKALAHFTQNSTAEFAIRPFILAFPEQTMAQMEIWAKSENKHLRRLASEGCRPRLPWATALPKFKTDPGPIVKIIEPLICDESLYVRRSVANNLNDISKDNPQLVIQIARKHLGKNKLSDWTIKHACRTLLKQGDKETLRLFGYQKTEQIALNELKVSKKVNWGGRLDFEFELSNQSNFLGKLRIEFCVHFKKANGRLAPKMFKIAEGNYSSKSKHVKKQFSFKAISTRKYYPGEHRLEIIVNGELIDSKEFELLAQEA